MPTRDTAWPAGTPCWIDYGAADLDAARALYAELFGWTYEGGAPESGGYSICLAGGLPAAGMAQVEPGGRPRWTTWFATDDAAAAAGRVTEAGGSVVVPVTQVGEMGTMVLATDPGGHVFGLWQAGRRTGVQRFNEPGALVWNELAVEDTSVARAFYGAVLGFSFTDMDEMPGYATFSRGEQPLGGMAGLTPGAQAGWTTCFAVTSTDDAVSVVGAHDGKVVIPAEDTSFGRFAVLQDPWGAEFSVMQEPAG